MYIWSNSSTFLILKHFLTMGRSLLTLKKISKDTASLIIYKEISKEIKKSLKTSTKYNSQ